MLTYVRRYNQDSKKHSDTSTGSKAPACKKVVFGIMSIFRMRSSMVNGGAQSKSLRKLNAQGSINHHV